MIKDSEELYFVKDGYRIAAIVHRADDEAKTFELQVDTNFEIDASDDSPGLRIIINDAEHIIGVPYKPQKE